MVVNDEQNENCRTGAQNAKTDHQSSNRHLQVNEKESPILAQCFINNPKDQNGELNGRIFSQKVKERQCNTILNGKPHDTENPRGKHFFEFEIG